MFLAFSLGGSTLMFQKTSTKKNGKIRGSLYILIHGRKGIRQEMNKHGHKKLVLKCVRMFDTRTPSFQSFFGKTLLWLCEEKCGLP